MSLLIVRISLSSCIALYLFGRPQPVICEVVRAGKIRVVVLWVKTMCRLVSAFRLSGFTY